MKNRTNLVSIRVKEIAESVFRSVLKVSADSQGTFRLIISAKIDNEEKPLLILGNAHGEIEDGHCIAILNPDEDILSDERVIAGSSYAGDTLKNLVQGRCDLMGVITAKLSQSAKLVLTDIAVFRLNYLYQYNPPFEVVLDEAGMAA